MKIKIGFISLLLTIALLITLPTHQAVAQHARDYTQIDRHASTIPKSKTQNLNTLTNYLCEPALDDRTKVRAIYTWISQHIKYDQSATSNESYYYNFSSTKVLKKRKGVCTGFSNLFNDMCHQAGITSRVINGYSKHALTSRKSHNKPDHAWNVVYIDSSWYLIDVTWAQGLSTDKSQNNDYFLSSPYYFINTHLPSIEMWQLLDCPISMEHFKMNPTIVEAHLDTVTACYNYQDTINQYLSQKPAVQRLFRDQHIYDFNPTKENADIVGHALVDYAGTLIDTIEARLREGLRDSLVPAYQEVVNLLTQAYDITNFYPWQIDLYGSSLINLSIGLYQSEGPSDITQYQYFSSIIPYLNKAIEINSSESQTNFQKYQTSQAIQYKADIEDAISQLVERE